MISSLMIDPYPGRIASRWPGYVSIKSRSADRSPLSRYETTLFLVCNYVLINFSLPAY